ncbi:MAG: hypothetical protein SF182_27855 [Deltaproteobacteria bacterium]|nr:hypothetical protein [Deltaproteobacteria bacterium]
MDEMHRGHTLAKQGPIRIDLCGCGQVHVSIGPLTVRLAPAVLQALRDTLDDAAARLPQADSGLEELH